MNWLVEIFSSTSDQARLATTLIAAVIAIFVVFVNQWFLSKRARNIKLIEKIEETYVGVIKLDELFFEIHTDIVTNYHLYAPRTGSPHEAFDESGATKVLHIDELNKEFCRMGATVQMLSGLYFLETKEDIAALNENYKQLYRTFGKSESLSEYLEHSNQQRNKIKNILKSLYSKLSMIMEKYMH